MSGQFLGMRPSWGWLFSLTWLLVNQHAYAGDASTGQQFAVSENGTATVSVPIQVPRGIGGIEPQLSLAYSSGSGNGLVGLGWTLTGPSAITRCAKTKYHDADVRGTVTFSASDRFCMDGQRLVIVNKTNSDALYSSAGAEYRTFPDSFSRILAIGPVGAGGSPAGFTVETKSGLIMEFGTTAASQIPTNFSVGTPQVINRWMLQRIMDRNGNSATFFYCKGQISGDGATCNSAAWSGSAPIQYIRYTDRGATLGTSAVIFGYALRPDVDLTYTYGSAQSQKQRLISIQTYIGFTDPSVALRGNRVRKYTLNYEPLEDPVTHVSSRTTRTSRLISITETGATDADALPPLQYTYASDLLYGTTALRLTSTSMPGTPKPPSGCGYKTLCP